MPNTPNIDNLHVRFSRAVEDPVETASADGKQFSIEDREDYINRAVNDLVLDTYAMAGSDRVRDVFQGLISTQAISFSSAGVALEDDDNEIIELLVPVSLTKSGSSSVFVHHGRKEELDSNIVPHITAAAYTIYANLLYAYESGTILNAGTGTFFYIKKSFGEQGVTDIQVSPGLFDAIVDYAATLAFEDTGELQSADARAGRVKVIKLVLGGREVK
jgi:hypothetical protein